MLVKPLHLYLTEHPCNYASADKKTELTEHFVDCGICDFQFCIFVHDILLPFSFFVASHQIGQVTYVCKEHHLEVLVLYRGRAPPATA